LHWFFALAAAANHMTAAARMLEARMSSRRDPLRPKSRNKFSRGSVYRSIDCGAKRSLRPDFRQLITPATVYWGSSTGCSMLCSRRSRPSARCAPRNKARPNGSKCGSAFTPGSRARRATISAPCCRPPRACTARRMPIRSCCPTSRGSAWRAS